MTHICIVTGMTMKIINDEDKNSNFVQMRIDNMGAVRELMSQHPVAANILMFLSQYMNTKNAVVCPSKVLEEVTGKGRVTVSRSIKKLKDAGYIVVLKAGTTNVYVLNPHVVWKAKRSGKNYCEFEGPILISQKENPEMEYLIREENRKHLAKH